MSPLRLNIMVIGAVVLLVGGFTFGLLMPGVKDLKASQAQAIEGLTRVKEGQSTIGNVSEIYEAILKMDQETKGFSRRLPNDRQFGEFLNEVSGCLKKSGIIDYSLAPQSPMTLDETQLSGDLKAARDIAILPVGISFRGKFSQVFELLDCLEHLERLSQVEKMSVINEEKRPGSVRIDLVLHTYYHSSPTGQSAGSKGAL
jgi:Tfp pilus assembly protein PilO